MPRRERGAATWKVAVLLAKVAISAALLLFLLRRIPLESFRDALQVDRPRFLAAALGLFLFSNVLGAYQWGRLLRHAGISLSFGRVIGYYHVGLFFNNFLPANIGGDIVRVMDASRHGSPRSAAISTVLMDRLIGTAALASLALATSWPVVAAYRLGWLYVALLGFFAIAVGLLWAAIFPEWMLRLERFFERIHLGALVPRLEELSRRMAEYRRDRRGLVQLFGVALLTQLSRVGVHALVARALGIELTLHYFFLFVPLLAVLVSLPLSFNGIGVREGAGVLLFGLVGVDRAHAFSLQFMAYLVAVAVSLLGGMVFLLRLPGRRRASPAPGGGA